MKRLSAPTISLCLGLLISAAITPLPVVAQQGGAEERAHIVAAQQAISRAFGGRKINQRWENGYLLLVWQAADGARILARVDPRSGSYQVLRHENPRR